MVATANNIGKLSVDDVSDMALKHWSWIVRFLLRARNSEWIGGNLKSMTLQTIPDQRYKKEESACSGTSGASPSPAKQKVYQDVICFS